MNKSCSVFQIIFVYILWLYIVVPINGKELKTTKCLDCSTYFEACTGLRDKVEGYEEDVDMVEQVQHDDENVISVVKDCVPNNYKLTADVKRYLCFQKPRCTVAAHEDWKVDDSKVLLACRSCGAHCGCKLKPVYDKQTGKSGCTYVFTKAFNIQILNSVTLISLFNFIKPNYTHSH